MPLQPVYPRGSPWLASVRLWTWAAVLASVAVCLAITWLHFEQDRTINRTRQMLENVREARIDLAKGFLNVTLSDEEQSPVRRAEGLALLDQAIAVLQQAARLEPGETVERGGDFERNVAAFGSLLNDWSHAESNSRHTLDLRLRIAFHELERQAGGIDVATQHGLQMLDARLDREFAFTLVTAMGLLSGICSGVYLTGRNQQATLLVLQESESRFRGLYENAVVGFYRTTPDGRIVMANPALLQMLGYDSLEELAERNLGEEGFEPEYPRTAFKECMEREGEVRGLEAAWKRRNGCTLFVLENCRAVRNAGGGILFYDGSVEDITERKLAEAAIRESDERYRRLFEAESDAIFLVDCETARFVDANEAAMKLYGYRREEILQLQATDVSAEPEKTLSVLATGQTRVSLRWHRKKDGTVFPIELTGSFFESGGRRIHVAAIRDITERQRAEMALQERELQLRLFVMHTPAAIAMLDHNMRYLVTSRRWIADYRLDGQDLTGRSHYEVFPDIPERWKEIHRRCLRGAIEKNDADMFPRVDGTTDWVRWEIRPWRTAQGEIGGLIIFSEVITDRKQAEEALRQSEENFRAMFELASIGMGQADPFTGRLLRVNKRLCEITGYPAAELLELRVADLTYEEDRERDAELFQGVVRGKLQDYRTEKRYVRKDGTLTWVNINMAVVRDAGGRPTRTMATIEDISKRKRMEDELRQFNQRLEQRVIERTAELTREMTERQRAEAQLHTLWSAVQQSPTVVMITDPNGAIEYVNPRFEVLTGYAAAEAVGQNPRLLKSGVHPREFYADLWRTLLAGQTWRGEICDRKKNGESFWKLATIAPVRNPAGEIVHFVSLEEDITERRRIMEELRQARDAAEAASRAKSAFLANMSHEIRTPMNAVLGYAQLLQQRPTLPPDVQEKLAIINRSGEHLMSLINAVLEMSKIEAGRMVVEPVRFDLPALLGELAGVFRLRAETNGLDFVVAGADALPRHVEGDQAKIRQVLMNLLGNAFKFTTRGRVELRVTTRHGLDGAVWLQAEVQDTGMGIPPEEQDLLFQPFQQTSSGQNLQSGTGLGLAISRQYARLMGGDLTVASRPGHGSTFWFEVPVRVVANASASVSAARRRVVGLAPGQPVIRVLVVDDNSESRNWLGELLGLVGFAVVEAADGREAIRAWESWKPQLVLTDLRMPGTDGYEVARRIKASAGGSDTVILALTAAVFEKDREAVIAAGASDVLTKPVDKDLLFNRIRAHLPVQFRYADEPKPAGGGERAARNLTIQSLAGLPAELRSALRSAVRTGESRLLIKLLQEVAALDAPLAEQLEALARNYDYDSLSRLLAAESA